MDTSVTLAPVVMAWSSVSAAAHTLYDPLIQNGNSGWISGLMVQNATNTNNNTLTTDYYKKPPGVS